MLPSLVHLRTEESGIKRVVEAYTQFLPDFGIELVYENQPSDLRAVHAGIAKETDIAICHGLYWSADYPAIGWELKANRDVVNSLRQARAITVPSSWVGEAIRRDMRRVPHVIPHGIDWDAWQHTIPEQGYILWNKNRREDVCDPSYMYELALQFREAHFVSTFLPRGKDALPNISEISVIPHDQMVPLVQGASVYLSTTKETFGIGILEAMAAGVPVLGFKQGGIVDLVQHGVNGYLAEPNNIMDLAEGLRYCVRHRKTLGANGRELAKDWTWPAACEKLAKVFELAMMPQPPTVGLVIPSYNYAEKVGRAIESATRQTYGQLTDIIVVDDGSQDGGATERVVLDWMVRDRRVRYVRQDNGGVANARNRGIREIDTKYVCCLDADDAIEPEFVSRCVDTLEADRSLGIAYTSLRFHLPDGQTGVSSWPSEWNFDNQLARRNQVPTCCVYRREMWEALGGYRARYCPQGAGSEDAEFWTRSGAYGWKAKRATPEPLFLYSWKSGRVSGNREYQEPDWLAWHPWAKDKQHPFASYATPKRLSHPVRQYDQPVVSVVIPVGKGHETHLIDALDSLDAQTFRRWEARVAWDTGEPVPDSLVKAYPHVFWHETEGKQGPGAARNLATIQARAPFLLFLDADDYLYPEAIQKLLDGWQATNAVVYSDYVGRAFIGKVEELGPELQKRILWRKDDGETALLYHASDYNCERAQHQPEGDKPWIWCNVTALVPREWHEEIGGFDESMPSWEDVDYWWRMAKRGHCFHRIAEPLLVYHFYSGGRRDSGHEMHADLLAYLRDKYGGLQIMPCAGCGGKKVSSPPPTVGITQQAVRAGTPLPGNTPADKDWVLVEYRHPNRGQHPVIGQAGFSNRFDNMKMYHRNGLYFIDYGVRAGGDQFYVHKADVAQASHLFVPVFQNAPQVRQVVIAAPEPVVVDLGGPEVVINLTPEEDDEERPALSAPKPINVEEVMGRKVRDAAFDLQRVPGVTAEIAERLKAMGATTSEKVQALGLDGLQRVEGVGPKRAASILNYLAQQQ
jgi:glycosyltransferase involved in cell wall biosynthesis